MYQPMYNICLDFQTKHNTDLRVHLVFKRDQFIKKKYFQSRNLQSRSNILKSLSLYLAIHSKYVIRYIITNKPIELNS